MNAEPLGAEQANGRTAPWCVTRETLVAGKGRDEIRAARSVAGEGPLVLDLSQASPRDNRQARALLRLLADAMDTGLELRLVGADRDLQVALRLVGLGDTIVASRNFSRSTSTETFRS